MNDGIATYLFGVAVGVVAGTLLFWLIMNPHKEREINNLRVEAIQKGFAEYVITDRATGKTEFQWKTYP